MRITFVLSDANLLGGTRVIAVHADGLRQRGHHVVVVSTPPPWPSLKQKVKSLLRAHGWPPVPRTWPSHLDAVAVEHRIIDRRRPVTARDLPDADVVIATWWRTADWVADLPPEKGVKAYFVQDYGAHQGQPLNEVARTWKLPLHKITISRWLVDLIAQHCGDADVTYVPNSVDHNLFHAPARSKKDPPSIGFMYSTRPQKGLPTILESIQRARRRFPRLHVVAYGPSEPAKHAPLPAGTEYTQRAPDCKLRDIYARCDAWLFGSRLEGFGLPILEAMACRTPVIATSAGAAPELLAGGGGLLVPTEDPHQMAGAIGKICTLSEEKWQAMSAAAYRTATQYSWNDATDGFERGLTSAIEKENRFGAYLAVSATAESVV